MDSVLLSDLVISSAEVRTYQERAMCPYPGCGEETKSRWISTGAVKSVHTHFCNNNHATNIDNVSFPRKVYKEVYYGDTTNE